ncbi:hypothetical protein [Desulfogranum marinum]|uniref:hypothetical protein n=1 Tax=Desulfogranum marinum TaxID=453220 RepID=UPI001964623D|nr:hypothetical protein [Desulfogranum marinum]MBM9514728.1 hypothetical protein [Desulfogranum marinum]
MRTKLFEYLYCENEEYIEYQWVDRVRVFNQLLWKHSYKITELEKELQKLAFESAICSSSIAFSITRDTDIEIPVCSIDEAKECEMQYCERLWNLVAFIVIDSIPATPKETKRILKIVDYCAESSFSLGVKRKHREIPRLSRAPGSIGVMTTVEAAEKKHMSENRNGTLLPFGSSNWQWEELLSFKRMTDELYEYCTDKDSWDNLAGEEGICLVRDNYVIGEIITCIN